MFGNSTSSRFHSPPNASVPGPGSYVGQGGLNVPNNPAFGLNSSSQRFLQESTNKENLDQSVSALSVSSISDDVNGSFLGKRRKSVVPPPQSVGDTVLKDAALRRKQMEVDSKDKMLKANELRCARLQEQLEEMRVKVMAYQKSERETKALWARKEKDFARHDRVVAQLEAQVKEAQAQREKAQETLQNLQIVEGHNKALHDTKSQVEQRLSEIQEELSTSRQSLTRYIKEIEEIAGDLYSSEMTILELQATVEELTEEVSAQKAESQSLQKELEGTRQCLAEERARGAELDEQMKVMHQRLEEVTVEGQEREKQYTRSTSMLQASVRAHEHRVAEMTSEWEAERSAHKDKARSFKQAIAESQRREEALREQSEMAQREIEALTEELEAANRERGRASLELAQLTHELQEARTAADDTKLKLTRELEDVKALLGATKEDLESAREEINQCKEKGAELDQKLAACEDEKVRLGMELTSQAKALAHQEQSYHEVAVELEGVKNDFKALSDKLMAAQEKEVRVQHKEVRLVAEMASQGERLQAVMAERDQMDAELEGVKKDLARTLEDKEVALAGVESGKVMMAQREAELCEALSGKDKAEGQATGLNKQLLQVQDALGQAHEEVGQLRSTIADLQDTQSSLEKAKEDLEKDVMQREEQTKQMEADAACLASEKTKLVEELEAVKAKMVEEIAGLFGEKSRLTGDLEVAQAQVTSLTSKVEDLQGSLRDQVQANETLRAQHQQILAEQRQTQDLIRDAQSKVERLQDSVKSLEGEAARLREHSQKMAGERQQLEVQVLEGSQRESRLISQVEALEENHQAHEALLRDKEAELLEYERVVEADRLLRKEHEACLNDTKEKCMKLDEELALVKEERDAATQEMMRLLDLIKADEARSSQMSAKLTEAQRVLKENEEVVQQAMEAQRGAEAMCEENMTLTKQLADTKLQVDGLRSKLLDIGYLERELVNATVESQMAKMDKAMAEKELTKLAKEVGDLAGHRNQKQKIKHLQNLKEELLRLQRDNHELEVELATTKMLLKKTHDGSHTQRRGWGGSSASANNTSKDNNNTTAASAAKQFRRARKDLSAAFLESSQPPQETAITPRRRRVRTPLKELLWTASTVDGPPATCSKSLSFVEWPSGCGDEEDLEEVDQLVDEAMRDLGLNPSKKLAITAKKQRLLKRCLEKIEALTTTANHGPQVNKPC